MSKHFEVQQWRYGKHVMTVAAKYQTPEAAQKQCEECYRSDWERFGHITPVNTYKIVEVD